MLTVLVEPQLACMTLCGKLAAPTKSLTGFTTLCGELIALEEPLAAFVSFSGMVGTHVEPLLNPL